MSLKSNPLAYFASSNSKVALHVRLNFAGASSRDEREAKSRIARIEMKQSSDGSWGTSVAQTVVNLCDLWLLGARDEKTAHAVNWLLETHRPPFRCSFPDGSNYNDMFFDMPSRLDRNGLREAAPFTPGCAGFVKTGAALFLAHKLKQGDAGRIRRATATINQLFTFRKGRPCSGSCNMNLLLAMSASPMSFAPDSEQASLAWTAKHQRPAGDWNKGIPFYQYTYALSQSPTARSSQQYEKALIRALALQRKDGSWSGDELRTLLMLHAIHSVGRL